MVTRAKSNQIGEKAVLFVEDILNEANWASNRLFQDFGIDLHVKVFDSADSRKAMPWEFHIQIKGTERLRVSKGQIHFVIDTDYLKDWYETTLPVLFTICDVQRKKVYWLWIKEYMEKDINSDWQMQHTTTLHIPVVNQLTPEILPHLLSDLKRFAFIREAQDVITMLEQKYVDACDYWDSYPHNAYYQPLSEPDPSIQDLALAKCILCNNYFWIDERITTGWDIFLDDDNILLNCAFTKIYEPWGHQPAVYSCDAPDSFCPVCLNGKGLLEKCASCGKYHFPFDETWFGEWDDPLITLDEVKELCAECVDYLRMVRGSGGMS